ncbi:hypothetical protein DFH06DRAFT_757114 [Mycena polygramma]|nr:hypothetical protein DFH06DRAFT_757114 [Mycena polygramma]
MTESPCAVPRLPPELERTIFELAALSHPTSIPKLMLIAWRIKEWVEPLLYRVVLVSAASDSYAEQRHFPVYTPAIMLRTITNKPPEFLQLAVKHLFFEASTQLTEVETILAACAGVTGLFVWVAPRSHLSALYDLRCLRRLTITATTLLDPPIIAFPAVFQNITHLELLASRLPGFAEDALGKRLARVPHLTHVAFNTYLHGTASNIEIWKDTRLTCIALLAPAGGRPRGAVSSLTSDSRFVCILEELDYEVEWLRGAQTGTDYWDLADDFIAARRAGKVHPTCYTISNKGPHERLD